VSRAVCAAVPVEVAVEQRKNKANKDEEGRSMEKNPMETCRQP